MTGQDLLDRMELVNQELQLQSGEADVARGLLALNVAQDYFETLAAQRPNICGSHTGTVTTAASTESTAFPAGLLRVDRLQLLDANSLPLVDLEPIQRTGGHRGGSRWPYYLPIQGTGKPDGYWTNGTSIYWRPLPDDTHTVRWYGLQAQTALTAGGTFLYPDIVAFPLAIFAVRLMRLGVDDPVQDFTALSGEVLGPVIETLSSSNRDGGKGMHYTQVHST